MNDEFIPDDNDVTEKILTEEDISRAVQRSKDKVDQELGQKVTDHNFQDRLDSRKNQVLEMNDTVEMLFDQLRGGDEALLDRLEALQESDDFKINYQRDTIDGDDWDLALKVIRKDRQLISRLVLMIQLLEDTASLLDDAYDDMQRHEIREQALSREEEFVKKVGEEQLRQLERVGDNFESRLETVFDRQDKGFEMLRGVAENLNEVTQTLKELEEGSSSMNTQEEDEEEEDDGEPEELSVMQQKLYDMVEENPEEDAEWFAEKLGYDPRVIRQWESKIKNKGYDFEIQ